MSLLPLHSSSAFGTTIQDNLTILIDLDHSAFGPTSKLVSSAVRHLCDFVFPEDDLEPVTINNFDEIAKDYYKQMKYLDPTGTQLLTFLAYLSGYYHELRHVHDLLSTTYGQDLLFRTLNCSQNTPALLSTLADWQIRSKGRRIPLPISESLDLPKNIKRLLHYYDKTRSDIRAFQNPRKASPAGLTTTHLLEASAIDVQLDFIHDLFGEEGVFELTKFIQKGQRSRVYLQIRNDLAEIFYAKGFRGWGLGAIINYLLWCSLTGTTSPGKRLNEGPTSVVLFEALAEYVARLADPERVEFSQIKELVSEFYERWSFLTPEQMICRVNQVLTRRASKALETAQQHEARFSLEFAKAYKSFIEAFKVINERILENPENYFGGRRYAWCVVARLLPSVHIKLRIDGKLHDFMSRGSDIIPFLGWNLITGMSTVFKMFMEGRSLSFLCFPETLLENICFDILKKEGWGDIHLKFEDKGSLFNW